MFQETSLLVTDDFPYLDKLFVHTLVNLTAILIDKSARLKIISKTIHKLQIGIIL